MTTPPEVIATDDLEWCVGCRQKHSKCECYPPAVPPPVMTPTTVRRVPNTPGTPRRSIRVPDDLWNAAAKKASAEGTDVSAVIRKALERYVRRKP